MKHFCSLLGVMLLSSCGDHDGKTARPSDPSPPKIKMPASEGPVNTPTVAAPPARDEATDDLTTSVKIVREMKARLETLAKENLPGGIRLANEMMKTNDPRIRHPKHLASIFAFTIHQAAIPARGQFTPADREKLQWLIKSELDPAIKDELLLRCILECDRAIEPSLAVMNTALESGYPSPPLLARMYGHVAAYDLAKTSNHVLSLPWKPDLGLATARVFAEWVMTNPEAGSGAVNAIPQTSPAYQWAVTGVIQATRHFDAESAAVWRKQITDPTAAEQADSLTYTTRRWR